MSGLRVLLCLMLVLFSFSGISYPAEEKDARDLSADAEKPSGFSGETSQARPILPPVIPSASSGISPTPSPHIAIPDIGTVSIDKSSGVVSPAPALGIENLPSSPRKPKAPVVYTEKEIPRLPALINITGEVLGTGWKEDGSGWLEVRDLRLDRVLKIKTSKKTLLIDGTDVIGLKDVGKGSHVDIIFKTDEGGDVATFISILTEGEKY